MAGFLLKKVTPDGEHFKGETIFDFWSIDSKDGYTLFNSTEEMRFTDFLSSL
jgi:hypothetical protein